MYSLESLISNKIYTHPSEVDTDHVNRSVENSVHSNSLLAVNMTVVFEVHHVYTCKLTSDQWKVHI